MSAKQGAKRKASEREIAKAPAPKTAEAKIALRPSVNAAAVIASYAKPLNVGDAEIGALMVALSDDLEAVWAGNMKRPEALLYCQAHALQAIFMNLSRRAALNIGEYPDAFERYLRMALKAQNQCRMTLETLATIKNPPVVFARQANINNGGQQQVNNGSAVPIPGARAPAANSATEQTELLEASDGQRMDSRATSMAGSVDPNLATVGAVHWPAQH